jgi:hypothetical protein
MKSLLIIGAYVSGITSAAGFILGSANLISVSFGVFSGALGCMMLAYFLNELEATNER